MGHSLIVLFKLVLLCVALNLLRYFLFGFLEGVMIMGPLMAAMEQSKTYFNTDFQTIDWVTSFFYNFVMWFVVTVAFHFSRPHLKGHIVTRSLKVYGLMLIMFASISAIYMNHYSHPKDFYLYNILDSIIVFPLVGLANAFLYPLFFRQPTTTDQIR